MSKVKQLPSHIVSLIHHVELYQSGWWDKGVQNLIIACIGNSGNTLFTSIQVFDQIKREFGIDIDWGRFEKQWNNLSGDHIIVRTGSQKQYQLNKEYYDLFLADLNSQNAIEDSSKVIIQQS